MADDRPALAGLPYPQETYSKESEAAFRREVDRSFQSMEAFVHNKVTGAQQIQIATIAGSGSSVVTGTVAGTYTTICSAVVAEQGYYKLEAHLRHTIGSTPNARLRIRYSTTGDGQFMPDVGSENVVTFREGTTYATISGTGGRPEHAGQRVLRLSGGRRYSGHGSLAQHERHRYHVLEAHALYTASAG